jgi:hypothetical protein
VYHYYLLVALTTYAYVLAREMVNVLTVTWLLLSPTCANENRGMNVLNSHYYKKLHNMTPQYMAKRYVIKK